MANQDEDFKWFQENKEDLYRAFPNKYLVISDKAVRYEGRDFDEALGTALHRLECCWSSLDSSTAISTARALYAAMLLCTAMHG